MYLWDTILWIYGKYLVMENEKTQKFSYIFWATQQKSQLNYDLLSFSRYSQFYTYLK